MESKFHPNDNFNYFLYWMCERMNIFWRRLDGQKFPWTEDPAFQGFKFTNVYRYLDRVSQYLIREVIYNGKEYSPKDMFFRILLYKHFNSDITWEALKEEFGDITYDTGWDNLAEFLDDRADKGYRLYSNAFIVGCFFYQRKGFESILGLNKHRAHFKLFEDRIFQTGLVDKMLAAKSFEELYTLFRKIGIFGDFMAQQYTIDMGYSPLFNFSENEFVITGPGSIRGIKFTFDGAEDRHFDYVGAIKWVHDNFETLMGDFCRKTGMVWNPLPWEPVPSLINLQNCFCETSKLAKRLGHTFNENRKERLKTAYHPRKDDIAFTFPPDWNAKMPDVSKLIID